MPPKVQTYPILINTDYKQSSLKNVPKFEQFELIASMSSVTSRIYYFKTTYGAAMKHILLYILFLATQLH